MQQSEMPPERALRSRMKDHPAGKGLRRRARTTNASTNTVFSPPRFGRPARGDDATAESGAIGTAPRSRGLEEPREVAEAIEPVDRAFAFLDLRSDRNKADGTPIAISNHRNACL